MRLFVGRTAGLFSSSRCARISPFSSLYKFTINFFYKCTIEDTPNLMRDQSMPMCALCHVPRNVHASVFIILFTEFPLGFWRRHFATWGSELPCPRMLILYKLHIWNRSWLFCTIHRLISFLVMCVISVISSCFFFISQYVILYAMYMGSCILDEPCFHVKERRSFSSSAV